MEVGRIFGAAIKTVFGPGRGADRPEDLVANLLYALAEVRIRRPMVFFPLAPARPNVGERRSDNYICISYWWH
jgi:hypothetical protein